MDLYKLLEQRQNRNIFSNNLPEITSMRAKPKPVEEVVQVIKKVIIPMNNYEYDDELTEVENIRNEAVNEKKLTMKKMRDFTKQMLEVES
jgi:hypothetical protein